MDAALKETSKCIVSVIIPCCNDGAYLEDAKSKTH